MQGLPVPSPSHLKTPVPVVSRQAQNLKAYTHQSDQPQQSRHSMLIHAMLAETLALGVLLLTDMALRHSQTQGIQGFPEWQVSRGGHPWATQDLLVL